MARPYGYDEDAALAQALAASKREPQEEQDAMALAMLENKADNDAQKYYEQDLQRAIEASQREEQRAERDRQVALATSTVASTRVAEETKCVIGDVPHIEELNNMPLNGVLCQYRGGDMSSSRSLKNAALCRVPRSILRCLSPLYDKAIVQPGLADAMKGYFNKTLPQGQQPFTIPNFTDYAASLSFHVSSQVYGADPAHNNLFFHGWLYEQLVKTIRPDLGAQAYPLVGLFDPVNINTGAADPDQPPDPGWIGINTLVVADQHIHDKVGGMWSIGTDMARFSIPNPAALSSAWCVCVDPRSRRSCIMYLLIVPGDMEQQVEVALDSPTRWLLDLRDLVQSNDKQQVAQSNDNMLTRWWSTRKKAVPINDKQQSNNSRIADQITEIINVYDSSQAGNGAEKVHHSAMTYEERLVTVTSQPVPNNT
jgi:hypothetical protein